MPSARPQRRRTSTTAMRGGAGLRVFSVDSPLDVLAMAKLVAAIAAERQAERDGRPTPHMAGRDKLADLRPNTASDDPTGDQAGGAR